LVISGTLVGATLLMLRDLTQPGWLRKQETPLDFLKKAYVHTVLAPLIVWKLLDKCDNVVEVGVKISIADKSA